MPSVGSLPTAAITGPALVPTTRASVKRPRVSEAAMRHAASRVSAGEAARVGVVRVARGRSADAVAVGSRAASSSAPRCPALADHATTAVKAIASIAKSVATRVKA